MHSAAFSTSISIFSLLSYFNWLKLSRIRVSRSLRSHLVLVSLATLLVTSCSITSNDQRHYHFFFLIYSTAAKVNSQCRSSLSFNIQRWFHRLTDWVRPFNSSLKLASILSASTFQLIRFDRKFIIHICCCCLCCCCCWSCCCCCVLCDGYLSRCCSIVSRVNWEMCRDAPTLFFFYFLIQISRRECQNLISFFKSYW